MPRSIKRESEYERERRRFVERVSAVEEPRPLPVVEGMLRRGEARTLAGPPKSGKTNFAAALGAAVSRGEPFGGMRTWRTNVLYLAAEESPLEWRLGVVPQIGATDRWFRVVYGPFALDDARDWLRLRAAVEFGGIGLVIVDPLLAAGDPWKVFAGLRRLCREKNVAGLAVHHGGAGLRRYDLVPGWDRGRSTVGSPE